MIHMQLIIVLGTSNLIPDQEVMLAIEGAKKKAHVLLETGNVVVTRPAIVTPGEPAHQIAVKFVDPPRSPIAIPRPGGN